VTLSRRSTDEEIQAETNRVGARALALVEIIWSNPDLETQSALSDAIGWEPTTEDFAIQMTARLCLKIAENAIADEVSPAVAARVVAMMHADRSNDV
jgi:hypothetical protein